MWAARFFLFLFLLLACAVTTARAADDYAGFYAASHPLKTPRQNLEDAVYASDAVDGVYLRLTWRALEPQPGQYNWVTLDNEVARAVPAHKKISLGLHSGFFAPDWLYDKGVPKNTFYVGPHGGKRGRCEEMNIPSPWDVTYQQAYANLMRALARHLHNIPGAYEAVRIVKLTGINQRTDEMRLPAAIERSDSCQKDAIGPWRAAGYRPSKVLSAWDNLSSAANEAFPDKILAINILEDNDFPTIDEQGQFVQKTSPSYVDVKAAIIDRGLNKFPGRFAIQWNGLSATKTAPTVLKARDRGAIIGWQTNQFGGFDGSGCDSANVAQAQPCTGQSYLAILENGIAQGGRYIEVWPADVGKFPAEIRAARQHLH
jgi:hypothetical protein